MAIIYPVIVVPGITATTLRDEYPLPAEIVWSAVLNKEYERIALHPDNMRYETREPALLRAGQPMEIAYREMVLELQHNLRLKEDQPVPVYCFGYDWRQPLDLVEEQLAAFVDEVIERTKLLRHYHSGGYDDDPRVNFVAHSMGGLVVAGYLDRYGKKSRVDKVVSLATPFKGSFEAVIKIATGTGDLGTGVPSSREREAARVTPALYHLLPTCPGLTAAAGLPTDIFDPAIWHPTVVQTLQEYIRLHAVDPTDRAPQAQKLFAALLKQAKDHRSRIDTFNLSKAGLASEDWLCVAGVDSQTRVQLAVEKTPKGPDFRLRTADRLNQWLSPEISPGVALERRKTGDGTVPLASALPGFLGEENVVCVSPDDYGYWELVDRVTTKVAGFHGILPNMDMLHRLIVRHFTGRPDSHGNTWGRRVPGVADWQPPLKLVEKGA